MSERDPTHATDRRPVHASPVPVVLSEREAKLVVLEDASLLAVPAGWAIAEGWGWLRIERGGQWVETAPAHAQPVEGWAVQTSSGRTVRGETLAHAVTRAMGVDGE